MTDLTLKHEELLNASLDSFDFDSEDIEGEEMWSDLMGEMAALERIKRHITRYFEQVRDDYWRICAEREELAKALDGALDVIFYNADILPEAAVKSLSARYPIRSAFLQAVKKNPPTPMTEEAFDEILKERDEEPD